MGGQPRVQKYDVVVVGAGPAGCSAAVTCASLGMEVLLLYRKKKEARKPCGGVLPWITTEIIEDIFDEALPSRVMNNPQELGLYYVPPSGRNESGRVRNYRIHYIVREKFDAWLIDITASAGVEVLTETRAIALEGNSPITVHAKRHSGEEMSFQAEYLVGADGVSSMVRRSLSLESAADFLIVGQQLWSNRRHSDLEDNFYGFFRGDISIAYSYAIPKGDDILIGTGVRPRQTPHAFDALDRFKEWLVDDFNFDDSTMLKKETWAIPFGYFIPGTGNTLLVGDAAGLCNPLSGEGIRLGIESGEAAGSAISKAKEGNDLLQYYIREVDGIARMVLDLHKFVVTSTDESRQEFVRQELTRGII